MNARKRKITMQTKRKREKEKKRTEKRKKKQGQKIGKKIGKIKELKTRSNKID